jgi:hypothetical protein
MYDSIRKKRGMDMICSNCKKEYSDNFEYCPYCAEPVKKENKFIELKHITREERVQRSYKNVTIVGSFLLFLFAFPVWLFFGWFFYPGTMGNELFFDAADIFAVLFWAASIVVWIVARYLYWQITKNSKMQKRVRKQIISDQFRTDSTSICPKCGSHNIKIYREGYNYTKGFWLRTFDVKGGGYVAGMNSNRARCRCMNCGIDWATNYDYRLIEK